MPVSGRSACTQRRNVFDDERMYVLVMAIRPEAIPTDAAALTEMVLALDAENEKLRV
jgi:hypothetical protein